MTPQRTATSTEIAILERCQDLIRLIGIAEIVLTTEHVQPGTEEWDRREQGKALYDEGVDILMHFLAHLRQW